MRGQGNEPGVEAQAFALTRDTWTLGALVEACTRAFQREWGVLSVGALLTLVLTYGVSLVGALAGALVRGLGPALALPAVVGVALLEAAAQGVLVLGLMAMALRALQGGRAELAQLFGQVRHLPRYVFSVAVVALATLPLWGLLRSERLQARWLDFAAQLDSLVVPRLLVVGLCLLVVYLSLPLLFLVPELLLCAHPGLLRPLRNCYRVLAGRRLVALALSLGSGVLVLAGLVACCVGIVPALALVQLLMGGLYLALRRGADVEP